MKYYGIVSKIPCDVESGIYQTLLNSNEFLDLYVSTDRKTLLTDKEIFELHDSIIDREGDRGFWDDASEIVDSFFAPFKALESAFDSVIKSGINRITGDCSPSNKGSKNHFLSEFIIKEPISSPYKMVVLEDKLLHNKYILPNLLIGIFNGLPKSSFKRMMLSHGGSSLTIFEKKHMPLNIKHIGGEHGVFSEGLYISHPKDENILIPLNDYSGLVEKLTLEETIRAYEALGAKKIIIEDVTNLNVEVGGSKNAVKASGELSSSKELLREKHFGKGSFDVKRAEENKLFIADIPAITTVIEARKEGNILREKFTEHINLNMGLDIGVSKLFSGGVNVSHSRKWAFEVEFWDKNEL